MSRFLHLVFRLLAALVGVMILLGLLLVWRLNARPMTSSFLTPTIVTGIESLVPDAKVDIAHTLLVWDNKDHTTALHADSLVIHDKTGAIIADIPALDVEFSLVGMLFGQVLPTALIVDHPQIRLDRNTAGEFLFGGMASSSGSPGESADAKKALAQAARNLAHAHITHRLEIRDAVFNVHDETSKTDWAAHIPAITLERSYGDLTGQVDIEVHQKDHISTLSFHYVYDRRQGMHILSTRFANIVPSFFASGHPETIGLQSAAIFDLPLTGEIQAAFDQALNLESGHVQIQGGAGRLIYPVFWDVPRTVKSFDVKGSYDRKKHMLDLPSATLDFGGPKLNLSLAGHAPAHTGSDLDFDLTTHLENWPMDQFSQLWPKPIIANARDWIAAHISKGTFDRGDALFQGSLAWNNLDNINVTAGKGTIATSSARVDYLNGMPAVEKVKADGDFDLNQMTIQILEGSVGAIRLEPFTIHITGFEDSVQTIDIPLKLTGPIPDIMRLLDAPRLGYAKAIGLAPDEITGTAEGVMKLRFPLLKSLAMKDVDITASAALTDVASSRLIKGVDIAQGNLDLALDKQGFSLKGPLDLNKLPLQATWQQNFSATEGKPLKEAKITGTINGDQWKLLGIEAMNGTHGPTSVFFQLTQPNANKTLYFGTLEMAAAEIHIDQLNWKKAAGLEATFKFTAEEEAGKNINIKSIDLTGAQIKAKGDAVVSADATQLLSLNLKPVNIGRTNAELHFSGSTESKGSFRFMAEGASLDVSGLRGGKDPEHADPRPKEYRIKIGKLYTSDDGFITSARGYAIRDGQGWSTISLHGLADGSEALDMELTPQDDGTRVFSVTCNDFGKALKGLGFTNTVRNGKLSIHGQSTVDEPRVIEGTAKAGSFTVKNLPVLALLLNAASPFGITGLLTDSADFSRLGGKFRWQGDMIELKDVHASGDAVGLNIDGKVDMDSGAANLNGTIVPFSMINSVLNDIPVIGDLITGGKTGGVLAVAYTIKGTLADPKINVNPVSLLTPGFLRNLFFGGSEEDDTPDEKP